jgi:hypothetical protein
MMRMRGARRAQGLDGRTSSFPNATIIGRSTGRPGSYVREGVPLETSTLSGWAGLGRSGCPWSRPTLRTCAMTGCDLPATCRLVADFRRTTCEHLEEHLRALISGQT